MRPMKRDATSDKAGKGHGRTPTNPGCRMSGCLQRSDASRTDRQGVRQIQDHDLAMDQTGQGQSKTAEHHDLGQRRRDRVSAWQAYCARNGGFVPRMLGNGRAEPSDDAVGPDRCSNGDTSGQSCGNCGRYPAPRGSDLPAAHQIAEASTWGEAYFWLGLAILAGVIGLIAFCWESGR